MVALLIVCLAFPASAGATKIDSRVRTGTDPSGAKWHEEFRQEQRFPYNPNRRHFCVDISFESTRPTWYPENEFLFVELSYAYWLPFQLQATGTIQNGYTRIIRHTQPAVEVNDNRDLTVKIDFTTFKWRWLEDPNNLKNKPLGLKTYVFTEN